MQGDRTVSASIGTALGFFGWIGNSLEDQVRSTTGRKRRRAVTNACEVVDIHSPRPVVCGVAPPTR